MLTSGRIGQFDVIANDEKVSARGGNWFTRRFGAGYPNFDDVISVIEQRQSAP